MTASIERGPKQQPDPHPYRRALPRRVRDQTQKEPAVNIPTHVGGRYLCFVIVHPDRGYGGPYGQARRPLIWRCVECGHEIPDHTDTFTGPKRRDSWAMKRLAEHHECGRAPCARCGEMLLRRKDGSPRQHAHNRCPGKTDGDKIEREFVKHMAAREYR